MNTKEKIAVMQAWLDGKEIQVKGYRDGIWYGIAGEPNWTWGDNIYRIKPEEISKPSIEWSHVAKHLNFLAADQSGATFLYEYTPAWSPTLKCWLATRGEIVPTHHYQSFKQGVNCPPEDSLVERPKG